MAQREDGMETLNRILNSACEVFAENGYHAAKVAEICRRAGANVSAVNYYFGDKATLYVRAWEKAFKKCVKNGLPNTTADTSPENRLRAYIYLLIQDFYDQSDYGQFTRLYLMELAKPTGLIQNIWREMIEPRRQVMIELIREIMKKETTDETVLFCEMSIINQCRTLLTIRLSDLEYFLDQPISPDLVKRMAEHITRFSLAGIKEVCGDN